MSTSRSYLRQEMWSEEEKIKARQLKQQGYKYREIGQRIGRTAGGVSQFFFLSKQEEDSDYQDFIRHIRRRKSKDPRSQACQAIKVCNGKGCYRSADCPAHAAFLSRHRVAPEIRLAI